MPYTEVISSHSLVGDGRAGGKLGGGAQLLGSSYGGGGKYLVRVDCALDL